MDGSSSTAREADERRRERVVLTVAVVATAMGFIDANVVAVAVPQMRASLGASFAQIQWVTNAYLLLLTAFMLLAGGMGDRFGTARVFAAGVALFTGASVLCAVAPDAASLIAFRALQGLGAAFMVPGSMVLIARHTARERRGRAMGIWVGASAVTTSLGPAVGSLFLAAGPDLGWRLVFAVNLPLGLLVLWLLVRRVPADGARARAGALDWTGAILVTAALGLLAMGLTFLGEARGEGNSIAPLLLLLAGIGVGGVAVWWELRARHPMIDLRLFAIPSFSAANAMTVLVWAGLQVLIFFLPMVLIVAWGRTPQEASLVFVAFGATIAVTSPLAGRLADRFGARSLLVTGSLVAAAGYLAIGVGVGMERFWSALMPAMVLAGLGVGLCASPLSAAVMSVAPDDKGGTASGINNMASRMAGLFAIAGLGAFLSHVHDRVVDASSAPEVVREGLAAAGYGERLTGGLYTVAAVELQRVAMGHAFVALAVACAVLALAGVACATRVRA